MKATILKQFGGIENLTVKNIAIPEIRDNEVLIRVEAISINPVDIKTRQGFAQAENIKNDCPMILGWDLSGKAVKVGSKVYDIGVDDEVFGMVNFPGHGKTYAECVAAPAGQLAHKPKSISHEEAAAASLAALTAWKAVVTYGKVKKGDKILIHGASGGVGHYTVQIAKHFGAEVTATASDESKDFVKSLGVDNFIDYKSQRFEQIVPPMDLIIDSIGSDNFVRSITVLKPNGIIVNLPTNKAEEAKKYAKEKNVVNFFQMLVESNGEAMRSIAKLLADKQLKSHIAENFSFDEIPKAHQRLEAGKIMGKITVTL